jgi:hypothetical protein
LRVDDDVGSACTLRASGVWWLAPQKKESRGGTANLEQ